VGEIQFAMGHIRLRKIDGWQHKDRYEEIVNRAA